MSLIVCSECKHEVSSYAEFCPNCGYPIKLKQDNHEENDSAHYDILLESNNVSQTCRRQTIKLLIDSLDISITEAFKLFNSDEGMLYSNVSICNATKIKGYLEKFGCVVSLRPSKDDYYGDELKIKKYFANSSNGINSPILCPRCGSSQVTTGTRGYSLIWGFIGAGKTVNRCGKCGYSWKP